MPKTQEIPTTSARSSGLLSGKTLLIGVAGGLAALALMKRSQHQAQSRRFSDRGTERRDPMHFFLAGRFPNRRAIDRSGQRPLFERRQSVYESY